MIKTFSDVKKRGFIYSYEFNSHEILIKKYKILDKKIESYRDKGKFGGTKITKVKLTLELKEYCNQPYVPCTKSILTVNGKHGVHQEGSLFFGTTFFASKQNFIRTIQYYINRCERNINQINTFIANNE